MHQLIRDFSLSAATAGFVAVLVGFTSSVAIVFQAATALGATPAQISSWMWAIGLGMGLCTLVPSLWLRKPVMVAWSTPGAAVLAAAAVGGGFTLAQAVGAARRYVAAASCGLIYCVIGLFGAAVTGVLMAFPRELVVAVAGLALLGTIGGGLAVALKDEHHREAALITFLVTLSGLTLAGIGSAFWGVAAGAAAMAVQQWRCVERLHVDANTDRPKL